jgi:hypothetical protein
MGALLHFLQTKRTLLLSGSFNDNLAPIVHATVTPISPMELVCLTCHFAGRYLRNNCLVVRATFSFSLLGDSTLRMCHDKMYLSF